MDITATSAQAFRFSDSNPGRVHTGGGDALLAGIVHAGPSASIEDTARWGLECARCAVESPEAVSDEIKNLRI